MKYYCKQCPKFFYSRKSLASHTNHHNPEYKKKIAATSFGSNDFTRNISRKLADGKKAEAIEKYKLENRKCEICFKELTYPDRNKTCSKECRSLLTSKLSSGRRLSEESKKKISESIVKIYENKPSAVKQKIKKEKIIHCKNCIICGAKFKINIPSSSVKSCSPECSSKLISERIKTAIKEGRHLGNGYRNRSNLSFLERSFKEWLDNNFPMIEYHFNKTVKIYDNGKFRNCYYIDFYFPSLNIGIELDGKQHLEEDAIEYDRKRDLEILDQYGIIIHRIGYGEYMEGSRIEEIKKLLNISIMERRPGSAPGTEVWKTPVYL